MKGAEEFVAQARKKIDFWLYCLIFGSGLSQKLSDPAPSITASIQ